MTEILCVPRNDDELFRIWGGFIVKQLQYHNKVASNFEDIYQTICMRLVESKIIARFHEKIARSRPLSLTTAEVVSHLGISYEVWVEAQTNYRNGGNDFDWMPDPLQGEPTAIDATWSTDDIENFKEKGSFERVGAGLIPKPTVKLFRPFLSQAIHNTFVNYLRTLGRRHKERVVSVFFNTSHKDNMSQEDMFDILCPTNIHTRMETSITIRHDLSKMKLSPNKESFIEYLANGYTVSEAADKLGVPRDEATKMRKWLVKRLA
jgi:hypothetical protein